MINVTYQHNCEKTNSSLKKSKSNNRYESNLKNIINRKDNLIMKNINIINSISKYNLDGFYSRTIADEIFANGNTDLTAEAHEALITLCSFRNVLMLCTEDLFVENSNFHTFLNKCIQNDLIEDLLKEVGLTTLNLHEFKDGYFTDRDFEDSNTFEYFCTCCNETASIEFDEAFVHTMNLAAEMLILIQEYLYHIDEEYGTEYMQFNISKLIAAEMIFLDDIIEKHSINNEKETK